MRRIVWDEPERVAKWVLERSGAHASARFYAFQAIGLESGGELVAGVVFTDYVPGGSIEMHVAAEPGAYWATREALQAAFRYAFWTCGVRRVTARVAESNARSRNLVKRLGFQYEGTAKNALPSESEQYYGLQRADCRYL